MIEIGFNPNAEILIFRCRVEYKRIRQARLALDTGASLVALSRDILEGVGFSLDTVTDYESFGNASQSHTVQKVTLTALSIDNARLENVEALCSNDYGLRLEDITYPSSKPMYNNILLNNISNNIIFGMYSYNSKDNNIYLNNLTSADKIHSYPSYSNIWNSPEKITYTCNGNTYTNYLGNYWSDYTGSDTNGDCIGDIPYIIKTPDQDNYPLMKPFEHYSQYGDVSGNGTISAYDASLIPQHLVGLINLTPEQQEVADVSDNGAISAYDAALILQYTVGLITKFPVEISTAAVPALSAKSEGEALKEKIAQLQATELNSEQRKILEQLKNLVSKRLTPERTILLQNYPNPFNPETWIPFKLAQDADVVIKIYEQSGRLIRKIDLGRKEAGYYINNTAAAYWDGRNDDGGEQVASGIYFYSIKAGEFTATKKLLLLK